MKMTEQDLLAFLESEQDSAYSYASGQLSRERTQAQRDYLRLPYGNEEDGRSAVVASDVFDTVEGMMPDLLDIFVSSDKAVVFEPVGAEDQAGAEQATNACNHVFYKQNNGFMVLYAAAKDALLMKTGGVKWWWDKRRTPTFNTYTADEMQIAVFLASNPGAVVMSQEDAEPDPQTAEQYAAQGMEPPKRITVRVKTVEEKGKVCIAPIPPDELHVSTRHNSILMDDCPYVAHVCERTLSDITQMGYDVTLDDVKAAQEDSASQDRELRQYTSGGLFGLRNDDHETDESSVRGWLREEYVLVDFDGDGIAERRKIVRLGQKILENVEFSHVPMAAWTPYILTHRFHGMSVADLVTDLQRITTDVWRQQLDNLYLANNQETVVLTDSQGNPLADLDDLLNRRPGGVLRERTAGAIRPYSERWQGIEAMPMVEQLSVIRENRTGYTRYSQGLDSDSLNKTATGVTKIMNASQKRMKLMARIMAEALVAPTFRGIFKTLSDYCMEKLSFRLNGEFVQYDPQEWRDGYDMSINVGLGTGDTAEQLMNLHAISQAQLALLQSPLGGRVVTEQNVYAVHARIVEKAGFKGTDEFWTNPAKLGPPPPPPPDPKVQLEQAKMQASAQESQAKRQDDAQRFQAETQMQMAVDQNRQEYEARQKQMELQQQAQLAEIEAAYKERADAQRIAFEQWKAELDANVKLQIAQLGSVDKEKDRQADVLSTSLDGFREAITQMGKPKKLIRGADGRAEGIA